jgi:preprotein translocase subunit SecA
MRLFGSERIASLMDKMGHKEGEVLQHSMISKSIERAQKKVEENNFGIRKRLLEYDDVMNAQRNAIYQRRRHALFGERLSIDIDNAMFEVCRDLAEQFSEKKDYAAFRIEAMKHLATEPSITEEEFAKDKAETITDKLYHQVREFYNRKTDSLREQMLPTLTQILNDNGDKVENIVIPFTDGQRGLQIYANLKESVAQNAMPVQQELEKNMTLAMIDESWKNHLRVMDDLRNSVQMASYEQKDPLLIYKFEAFSLYKQAKLEIDRNIVSFLLRAGIPVQDAPQQAQRLPEQHTDMSGMRMNKAEIDAAGQDYAADENDYYTEPQDTAVKRTPVQAAPKIGRNDACPCGSGKKYKNCHGKGL